MAVMNIDFSNTEPFVPEWPEPAPHLIGGERPPAPELRLDDILSPALSKWVSEAAESKGAPADYVLAGLLVSAASAIGNARWVHVHQSWKETCVLWAAIIGNPSAGKSPALDAALSPVRDIEARMRKKALAEFADWEKASDLAKLVESSWKESVKRALKEGNEAPERPAGADAPPMPHIPRLIVNDATVEVLGLTHSRQPKGILQVRDELSGWMQGMTRYSNGGTDRPFWLEAYGGRPFTVDRMSRASVTIDRMCIGLLGGIQPDRLAGLLLDPDGDDGLLARIMPFWPEPAPIISTLNARPDDALVERMFERLHGLEMQVKEDDSLVPWMVYMDEDSVKMLDDFRRSVRSKESGEAGLMVSFLGKLPGLSIRLSLVLAMLDWASSTEAEPVTTISADTYGRAVRFLQKYLYPMARRSYASAGRQKMDAKSISVVNYLRRKGWSEFTSKDIMKSGVAGLTTSTALNPVLNMLVDCDVIRPIEGVASPLGGRPARRYMVNPRLLSGSPGEPELPD